MIISTELAVNGIRTWLLSWPGRSRYLTAVEVDLSRERCRDETDDRNTQFTFHTVV